MILHCNYEEIVALEEGARTLLSEEGGEVCSVLAPSVDRALVEDLVPRLRSDLDLETLAEQRRTESAVSAIVACLRSEMETRVAAMHPAAEETVAAYFDFAHGYAVLCRLREMGDEMEAVIELLTGEPADDEIATTFVFPN